MVWLTSRPTYAIREPCTAIDIPGNNSPDTTLTSVPPRITSDALRSPLAVATNSGTQSASGGR
ncbi:hypothetical protein [Paenibacillus terrae]|uniref:hypothetical protein n=1 Tax=Paenibacillus terrae TaxID=159743 RepID=UPI001F444C23|nr:hypothetical protein [Paenibacillus terrae]